MNHFVHSRMARREHVFGTSDLIKCMQHGTELTNSIFVRQDKGKYASSQTVHVVQTYPLIKAPSKNFFSHLAKIGLLSVSMVPVHVKVYLFEMSFIVCRPAGVLCRSVSADTLKFQ